MKTMWRVLVCVLALALTVCAVAQDNGSSNDPNHPVLNTRPQDSYPNPQAQAPYPPNQGYGAPDAVPEGTRFIIKLKDTLDTRDMTQGKRFKAELREDLVTPNGLFIPKGRTIKGHVGSFERGFSGARVQIALDEIETRHGWVPLISTVTGVPGDHSIRSTENEGELSRKGPDKKRVIINTAVGAGLGAAAGAAAGGGKGAAIGAAAGAGLGSGSSLLFQGQDLRLPKDTQLEVRLDRDLIVPAR